MDGGELIGCYRKIPADRLRRAVPADAASQPRRRAGDGLPPAPAGLSPPCSAGHFAAADARQAGDELQLLLLPELPLPLPLRAENELCSLSAEGNHACITVPGVRETMKHFFPDYKNYFYLPLEDTAVHKSIGIYGGRGTPAEGKGRHLLSEDGRPVLPPAGGTGFSRTSIVNTGRLLPSSGLKTAGPEMNRELKNYACDLLQRLL